MSPPAIVCVRHGETAWSLSGQHTSRTDVPLTEAGRAQARRLGSRLPDGPFAAVLSSPSARALETCRLAGLAEPEVCEDLQEWDYGEYEGRTTAAIREVVPGWSLWRDGVPGGETADQVTTRADRVIARAGASPGPMLVFSHGHFLRVLAARWLDLDAGAGRLFALDPASVSVLGWEREQAVIHRWNDSGH
jgi:probable phosphoglycerate mutase